MKCISCGKEIDENQLFCPYCGKRLIKMDNQNTSEDNASIETENPKIEYSEDETTLLQQEDNESVSFNNFSPSSPLSNYEVKQVIKSGGGGTVIRAYHKNLQKEVVIKKIHDFVSSGARRTEVDILKNLHHPNLPQVFDYFNDNGADYTVMDFIEGESLQELIDKKHKFTEKEVYSYAVQLADAVGYLHTQNIPIIHGDIKPDNIMVRADGSICLIDFNISGMAEGGKARVTGFTPGYSAPEHLESFEKARESKQSSFFIDARCDVYSIGATLYHIITGNRIDKDGNSLAKINISEGFAYVLNKALKKDPGKRYSDSKELLDALNNLHKSDGRYRRIIRLQNFFRLLFVIVGFVGIFFLERSISGKQSEMEADYDKCIMILQSENSEEEYESAFFRAKELFPDRIESYVFYSKDLYSSGNYDKAISFLEDDALNNGNLYEQSGIDTLYYVLGNCYFELGYYDYAANSFVKSLSYDNTNGATYSDLAVTLARKGDISGAKDALDSALKNQIEDNNLQMVKGEIALAEGNFQEAVVCFKECISMASDDYYRMRAYIQLDAALSAEKTLENAQERIHFLEDGRKSVSFNNQLLILSRLVQAYLDASSFDSEGEYDEGAINTILEINRNGWGSLINYNNLVILYQRTGDFENAEKTVLEMQSKYPNEYSVYKRKAFLEAEIQNRKSEKERNYSEFVDNYRRAFEMYDALKNEEKIDMEMQLLSQTYVQLVEGNWLVD